MSTRREFELVQCPMCPGMLCHECLGTLDSRLCPSCGNFDVLTAEDDDEAFL